MTRPRADARQNRALILAAAEAVIHEQGSAASLDTIAVRAGVGRATLFRNFRDRDALIVALLDLEFDRLAVEAERTVDDPDQLALLYRWLADRMSDHPTPADLWDVLHRDAGERVRMVGRFREIFAAPVERANRLRDEADRLSGDDMVLLATMLRGIRNGSTRTDRRRLAERGMILFTRATGRTGVTSRA